MIDDGEDMDLGSEESKEQKFGDDDMMTTENRMRLELSLRRICKMFRN